MACSTLLRVLYISQSLNPTLQRILQKNNIVILVVLVPQFLLTFHMLHSVRYFIQHEDHPFLLYQACMNPFSFYDIQLTRILIIDNFLLFVYDLVIALGNLYLWKFLNGQTEKNQFLREVDKKKERKRNFLSAKNSIITSAAMLFSYLFVGVSYGVKVCAKSTF